MISSNYILAVFGALQYGAWAFPVDTTSATATDTLTKLPRGRRALFNDGDNDDGDDDEEHLDETAIFTIVNQHTSAVKLVLTRGCDGTPGGNGWAPFPSMIDSATLRRNVRALLFVIRLDLTITTPFRSPFEFMRWHTSFVFFITHSLIYYVCRKGNSAFCGPLMKGSPPIVRR